jgi:glycosyltransferase involved in cell wall biosynthesis
LTGPSAVALSAYAVSWRRRRGIEDRVPAGVATAQRAMPARPLHAAWGRGRFPPVEWFLGPLDLVHGSNFVVPPTRRSARVVTVHDLTVVLYPDLCDPPTLAFPALVRRAVAEGAWVHTPSRFVADQVVAELGVDADRVRAVHHGIPPLPDPSGVDPPIRLPSGCGRYVLAVGTIEPRKDYPLLVAAFEQVASAHPDVALVIVGADGWGSRDFAAALAASPVRSKVVRAGYLDDRALAATLRQAAVLAYPSVYEGFGFPPLQAMAASVPVVATAAGAVPEVVGDGALVVAPGDDGALADALSRVLAGGAETDALISRGLERSARFTWDACAHGLLSLYREAVADRSSRPTGASGSGGAPRPDRPLSPGSAR